MKSLNLVSKEIPLQILSQHPLDLSEALYPVWSQRLTEPWTAPAHLKSGSFYGFLFGGGVLEINLRQMRFDSSTCFSLPVHQEDTFLIRPSRWALIVFRFGVQSQTATCEIQPGELGRLNYIDGCSDSIVIYPPKMGDPSLNYLYFPENVKQSFHTHPSHRIGCIIQGSGQAETNEGLLNIEEGSCFSIDPHERHRFLTDQSPMSLIAFHPDGDWGPTDHSHIMINRTFISK